LQSHENFLPYYNYPEQIPLYQCTHVWDYGFIKRCIAQYSMSVSDKWLYK